MIDLANKKIILTGGSRGIGLSILNEIYKLKAEILIIGTNQERLEDAKKQFPNIIIKNFNLSEHEHIEKNFKSYCEELGGIDVLINNAGITKDNLALRMSFNEWKTVLDVNLHSTFLMTQNAIKFMLKNKSGSIINITSIVAHTGNPGQANYTSSKAGVIAMSKSLAKEYARKNIRINCISPGFIESDMTKALSEDLKKKLISNIPMNKIGEGIDIAKSVIFLASDMSNYITGETIHVNGGMYMS
tara:strand:+ start:173 stop:907 length:735 start_codon:yes stop_codon:yes gene_type:complete